MDRFYRKRNDTARPLKVYLIADPASDFTGATAVFHMAEKKNRSRKKVTGGAVTLDSDSNGPFALVQMQSDWVNEAGWFVFEIEVTLAASAGNETYPSREWGEIYFEEDLG